MTTATDLNQPTLQPAAPTGHAAVVARPAADHRRMAWR